MPYPEPTPENPRFGRDGARAVEQAARLVLHEALPRHDSAITPGKAIWTQENVDELVERYVDLTDVPGRNFEEKLDVQLDGASPEACQLLAEVYFLNLLPLSNVSMAKKTELVTGVLARTGSPLDLPGVLEAGLKEGVFNGGVAFNTRRYWCLRFLILFARAFLRAPEVEQQRVLTDPLEARRFVLAVEGTREPAQRHALLYLMHPQFFLPVVKLEHREAIRDAFADRIGGATDDLDAALHRLVEATGHEDYYLAPWREQWLPAAPAPRVATATATSQSLTTATPDVAVPEALLADATEELAAELHLPRAWLQECVDLLRDRPQLVFYGPPGTGKTYVARKLAEHLAGDNVRLVQFHPSTSYEDFFEGYRPHGVSEGRIDLRLKPGPMRKIADDARKNPNEPYVLIIDEINRGNLARVFGELYFLLEYRDAVVDLLYAADVDEGFRLPENVVIIGTMNTADRSIALVDAAMRRRFAFVGLHPSEEPVRGMLRSWCAKNGYGTGPADLLDALNLRIVDADFRIGPSYLMRPAVHETGGLDRVWRTAILPLLEEHHYGQGVDVEATYGLAAIRRAVHGQEADVDADQG